MQFYISADNSSGCKYDTKEDFLKAMSDMVDECIAKDIVIFDVSVDASTAALAGGGIQVKNGTIKVRQWAAAICGMLEDYLEENDLMIPDADREGEEDEAFLFGDTYDTLEDTVVIQLADLASPHHKDHPSIKNVASIICMEFERVIQKGVAALPSSDSKSGVSGYKLKPEVMPLVSRFVDYVNEHPNCTLDKDGYSTPYAEEVVDEITWRVYNHYWLE